MQSGQVYACPLSTFIDIYRRCVLLPVLRLVGECHSYDRTPPADWRLGGRQSVAPRGADQGRGIAPTWEPMGARELPQQLHSPSGDAPLAKGPVIHTHPCGGYVSIGTYTPEPYTV